MTFFIYYKTFVTLYVGLCTKGNLKIIFFEKYSYFCFY